MIMQLVYFYLVPWLLVEICLSAADSSLYYLLTVWSEEATEWQYFPCRDDQPPASPIIYMHFSQPDRVETGPNPTLYKPCHCRLQPLNQEVRVAFLNNFLISQHHSYGYFDWQKSDPEFGRLSISIQAHADYTVLDVKLNDGAIQKYSLYGGRNVNLRVDGDAMGLECSNSDFNQQTSVPLTTTRPVHTTPVNDDQKSTLTLPIFSRPDPPKSVGPTYVIFDQISSSVTPGITPSVNGSVSSSKYSSNSTNVKLAVFIVGAVVIFVLISVISIVIILLMTRHKAARKKQKNRRQEEKKSNAHQFMEKAGNVYSTVVATDSEDQCEETSEDFLCEESFSGMTDYTVGGLNNLNQTLDIPNNLAYNLNTLDTAIPPSACCPCDANLYQPSRTLPLQHNNLCYQKNCIVPYGNNINYEPNFCSQAMNKPQNVDEFTFYPEITPISPELMHELNCRFPVGNFHHHNGEPADIQTNRSQQQRMANTMPATGMTTFRQAPHANLNQIKFQNGSRDGGNASLCMLDMKWQTPPTSKCYNGENTLNREIDDRIYNPVYANFNAKNPKHEEPTDFCHYAQIDPTSLVRLEKNVQNNQEENLIYAELDLPKK